MRSLSKWAARPPASLSLLALLLAPIAAACGAPDAGAGDISVTTSKFLVFGGGGIPMSYALCANEGQTCVIGGNKYVAFGSNNAFVFKAISGSFTCAPAAFGGQSPAGGGTRQCLFANFSFMRSESSTPVSGIVNEVAFGIDGIFTFKRVSGVPEPDPKTVGKTKACYQALVPYSKVTTGSTMTGLNNTPIAFGGNGTFEFFRLSGSQVCSGPAFGNPPIPFFCYRFPFNWVQSEGGGHNFNVSSNSTLYYGTGDDGNFLTRNLSPGTYECSNSTGGGDPAVNVGKNCYLAAN